MNFDLILATTDFELLAGQLVKVLFCFILITGVLFNTTRVYYSTNWKNRLLRLTVICFLLITTMMVVHWFKVDDKLLRKPRYVVGITTGYCDVFAQGKGIAFQYVVNGIIYRNCNSYHPVSVDSIVVPGGRYYVRYSEEYPQSGEMDFHREDN